MLTKEEVGTVVFDNITALVQELDLEETDIPAVEPTSTFPDLGLDSLMLARLIIELGEAFGVDPFETEEASVADLRNVGDLVQVYENALLAALS
jgi:acyl carrier protein